MANCTSRPLATLDVYLAGYLVLHGISPELEVCGSKVVFAFPVSDRLFGLIASYNSNGEVPVTDYVAIVKRLRGQMLTLRNNSGDCYHTTTQERRTQ